MLRSAGSRFCSQVLKAAQALRKTVLDAVTLFIRKMRPPRSEQAKTAIYSSRWKATCYCSLHLLPVTVSIYLITLNLKGHYVGRHLPWSKDDYGDSVALAFIQIAAKIQELLVIGSMAEVIIQKSIGALTNDHGLPLGLSTSGFSFAKISYFWSLAFLGSTFTVCKSPNRRLLVVYALTVLGGIIGLSIGPASAVLMLPRTSTWPQFIIKIWMNGTVEDFWPDVLRAEHLGEPEECRQGFVSGQCAQQGLPLLLIYDFYSRNDGGGFQIFTPDSTYPRIIDGTPKVKGISAESWTIAPHAATSRVLTRLWDGPQWTAPGGSSGKQSGQVDAGAAVVRTVCSPNVTLTRSGTSEVFLPDLRPFQKWMIDDEPGPALRVKTTKPLWKQRDKSRAGNEHLTTRFVTPDPNMTSVTTGVVILGPIMDQDDRIALTCSIDARWNDARHSVIKSDDYGIGNVGNSVYALLRGSNTNADLKSMALPVDDGSWRHVSAAESWLKGALEYEAPYNTRYQPYFKGVDRRGYNTTALATFILARAMYTEPKRTSINFWRESIPAIESVISTAFADVMSRTGSVREINRSVLLMDSVSECRAEAGTAKYKFCPPPPAIEAGNFTELHFNGSRTGYAYKASSVTDCLSLSVLTLYVVIILLYIASRIESGHGFSCWDTIEEMVLLAKNSQPTFSSAHGSMNYATASKLTVPSEAPTFGSSTRQGIGNRKIQDVEKNGHASKVTPLANTSSGIRSLSTMQLRLRIKAMLSHSRLASNDHSAPTKSNDQIITTEDVQLIVGDDEPPYMKAITPESVYGKRHS
ncbi:hypothetical protein ACLMJK_007983 [Lecanora helva]